MSQILLGYDVNEATWFYLSLLLIVAVFFRFGRIWSVRNLDLAVLLSISPGLLLVGRGERLGYVWLFVSSGLVLIRLLADAAFQRRPRLGQNLNVPGMAFLCAAAFAFLMVEAITAERLPNSTVAAVDRAGRLFSSDAPSEGVAPSDDDGEDDVETGPAASVLAAPVVGLSKAVILRQPRSAEPKVVFDDISARVVSIVAQFCVVAGLVLLGYRHFGDAQIGVAMATLYLLIPGTAVTVGHVAHVLPGALLLWAVVAYRKPLVSGGLMGFACGTLFFPVFLLPLWASFYDRRGALRFAAALVVVSVVVWGSLAIAPSDAATIWQRTGSLVDGKWLGLAGGTTSGFWSLYDSAFRIPVFAAYLVMVTALTFWPRRKTLEHLLAASAALVVGTQFWFPQQGGVYLSWYLPLLLAVVFRPSLLHRPPTASRTRRSVGREVESTQQRPVAAGTGPLFR